MGAGTRLLLALVCMAVPLAASAEIRAPESRRLQIQYAEKVSVAAQTGHVEFDAYGRRFALELASNDRVFRSAPDAAKFGITGGRLWRGKLDGAATSWVRLARVGSGLEGAIWDGSDLYVVTRYADIAPYLTTPLTLSGGEAVIYKLSDTIGGLPDAFCGLTADTKLPSSKAGQSGLEQYKTLVTQLRAAALTAPTDQLTLSLIADTELQSQTAGTTSDYMLARLNTADGIFTEQVGVMLVATDVRLMPSKGDPFTKTDPSDLLHQLADYRAATPAVAATGVAHLVTGKNLDGDPIGIGFLDGLCDPHYGASLSDNEYGAFYGALIMAHELGHNFGAPHDGETGSACESTPRVYLMAPNLNGSTTFSQCSLTQMAATITRARGACLGPAQYAEVAIQGPPAINIDAGQPFNVVLGVQSLGTLAVQGVNLTMPLPANLTFLGATVANGTCSVSASTLNCALGDIPAGETRNVTVQLQSPIGSHYELQSTLTASNDRTSGNNTTIVYIDLRTAVDLAVTASLSATRFYVNDLVDVTVDLASLRTQPAHGASLNVGIAGLEVQSYDAGPHTCTVIPQQSTLACQLADIAPGATSRIVVHTRAKQAWLGTLSAGIQLPGDGDSSNNYATLSYEILWERDITAAVDRTNLRAVIGAPYDLQYTITTGGRLADDNVQFRFNVPQSFNGGVEGLESSVGSCTGSPTFTCSLGTLTPGQVVTITAHVRYTQAGTSSLDANVHWLDGNTLRDAYAGTIVTAALRIDPAVQVGSLTPVSEGQSGNGTFYISSRGVDPAQNVVATLDVPAPVTMTALRIDSAATGWICTLVTPQHGECRGNFTSATSFGIDYYFTSDTPASGTVRYAITGDEDGDNTNNQASTTLTVRPYLDVGITVPQTPVMFFPGHVVTVNYTVTTGARPVPAVVLNITPGAPYNELVSVNGGAVTCSAANGQSVCPLGDLPGNANIAIAIQYRGLITGNNGSISVGVGTDRDDNWQNNVAFLPWGTIDLTDAEITTATPTAGGTAGFNFRIPLITVKAGTSTVLDVVVDIPLPAFATVDTVSSSAVCTGTTTLECHFDYINANEPRTIDVFLKGTAAGTFTSNITMTAFNDSSTANNSANVAVTVLAAASSSSGGGESSSGGGGNSGGGSGGGGRFEWLSAALLGLLVLWRQRRSVDRRALSPSSG